MFIKIIILFWLLPTLQAPTWCYVLAWLSFIWTCIDYLDKMSEIGEHL